MPQLPGRRPTRLTPDNPNDLPLKYLDREQPAATLGRLRNLLSGH
jgi:hypothetical protein